MSNARFRPGAYVTAVDDPMRWLAHLNRGAASDLWGIMTASSPAARTTAVQTARDHGRSWGDVAIALALGRHSYALRSHH